jgi:hypothetical protein
LLETWAGIILGLFSTQLFSSFAWQAFSIWEPIWEQWAPPLNCLSVDRPLLIFCFLPSFTDKPRISTAEQGRAVCGAISISAARSILGLLN